MAMLRKLVCYNPQPETCPSAGEMQSSSLVGQLDTVPRLSLGSSCPAVARCMLELWLRQLGEAGAASRVTVLTIFGKLFF